MKEHQTEKLARFGWLKKVAIILLLLFLLFVILIQIPAVQTYIIQSVVGNLTKDVDADIAIGHSELDIYKGVQLQDIVMTSEQDTLLSVRHINVSPRNSLLSLLTGSLALSGVTIEGVRGRVIRREKEELSNWQRLFQRERPASSDGGGRIPEIGHLRIRELDLLIQDEPNGERVTMRCTSVEIDIDQLVLVGDDPVVDVSRILLNEPLISMERSKQVDDVAQPDSLTSASGSLILPRVLIDELDVVQGYFISTTDGSAYYIDDLDITMRDLNLRDKSDWSMRLNELSGRTEMAQVKYAAVQKVERRGEELIVDGLALNLDKSKIKLDGKLTGILGWSQLDDPQVVLDIKPSVVYLQELNRLIPALMAVEKDPISKQRIQIEGDISAERGKVNANDLAIWINQKHHFRGALSFDRAERLGDSQLNVQVGQLYTHTYDLNRMSSQFQLPTEVLRLQHVDFQGSFDGFLNDFVANGKVTTALGDANMDIKFDLSGGGDLNVLYDGFLALDSFDLAGLTLNEDFGKVTATMNISDGMGSSFVNSSANINAVLEQFEFKGYSYEDANFQGRLSSRVIDGHFDIEDKEIAFQFDGLVDLSKEKPLFDFEVHAEYINFCQLNITDFPCEVSFSSDINLAGDAINTLNGQASIRDLLMKKDTTQLLIREIDIHSRPGTHANAFEVNSDFLDFDIEGRFNLLHAFQHSFYKIIGQLEDHNEVWQVKIPEDVDQSAHYRYSLLLKEATPVFEFLNVPLVQEGYASITGGQTQKGEVDMTAAIPNLSYKNITAESINISLLSMDTITVMNTRLSNLSTGGDKLESFSTDVKFYHEYADWGLHYKYNDGNLADIYATSEVVDDGYVTDIVGDHVLIDSSEWDVVSSEKIGLFPGKIDIPGLKVSDGVRYVKLKDVNHRGVEVEMNDFELAFINPIINYDKLYFEGGLNSKFSIADIFERRGIEGYVEVPDFTINGDEFGKLLIQAKRGQDEGQNVAVLDMSIQKDTQNLYASGFMNIDSAHLDVNVALEHYPMDFFEYIIDDGISQTQGHTDINIRMYGPLSDLKMNGVGVVKDAGVRVDFLGAYYRMDNEIIKIDENFIDFNGVQLIDALGNTAVVTGGLRHNLLADIRADLLVESPRFIGLNTTIKDNPLYYGLGVGEIAIAFDGPFDAIDIAVDAKLEDLSKLYVPLNSSEYSLDESFIVFANDPDTAATEEVDSTQSIAEILKESGVNFDMTLEFTPEAVVSIIYDETTNNVLEGTGEGIIDINVKRDGEFTAYGNYEIQTGQYLYTAYGVIAKPFVIQDVGTVVWTGDPFNANLNVTATATLRAPLTNLLQEFAGATLTDAQLNTRRDVNLKLILTGELFRPDINFDITFPDLTGNIRTYAENKIRTLRSVENGLNNQVVGLMVFSNFLPESDSYQSIGQGEVGATGANTITQYLTSQLSIFFSEYLSSKLGEDDFIQAIDFEIAVAQNTLLNEDSGLFEGLLDVVPDEVQLNLKNHFKNDNFVLNIGGNFVRENPFGQTQNYVTGDFSLDWFITDDKRLKLRFYGQYDYDDVISTSRRQRYGFGINYRHEFGSVTDFMDDVVEDLKRLERQEDQEKEEKEETPIKK